jgi:diguanylate cyclase (GGDEF)-like protein
MEATIPESKNNMTTLSDHQTEIAELIQKQKTLEHENAILLAISSISSILLQMSNDTFEGDLLRSMEIMGEAAEVNRVYIWQNHTKDGDMYASQIYEWASGAEAQQGKDIVHDVPYKDIPVWGQTLAKGECINGLVSGFSANTKKILSEQEILSILVVPIFLHKRYWGFVGFDDCHHERVFSQNEEKILRSASELIANALIRNDMERNIQHLEKEVDKIYYDPLTGIYNRRYLDESLERIIGTLSRSGSILSLMMVDIDFFKKYNDTYGHLKGDDCLKAVAETLRDSITRKEDFVARYGGEEFIIVLPNANEIGAAMIAERMIENVRNNNIPHEKNGNEKRVTVSIGVTSGEAKHAVTAEDFIRRADEMLYEAKRSGRNKYMLASL